MLVAFFCILGVGKKPWLERCLCWHGGWASPGTVRLVLHLQFKRNILFSSPTSCAPTHTWCFSDSGSGEEEGAHWCSYKRVRLEWGYRVWVPQSRAPQTAWALWQIPGPHPRWRGLEPLRAVARELCSFKAPLSDSDHLPDLDTMFLGYLLWPALAPMDLTETHHNQDWGRRAGTQRCQRKREAMERHRLFSTASRWCSHSFFTYLLCTCCIHQLLSETLGHSRQDRQNLCSLGQSDQGDRL